MQYTERIWDNLDWATIVLVGCLLCYALAKHLYPRRFQEFVQLPVTNKYFLIQGKGHEINNPFNIILFVPQVLCVSLFVLLCLKTGRDTPIDSSLLLFVQICTAYAVFVLSKFLIEKMIGSIFNIENTIDKYLYQKLSYRNFLAVVVFFANLLLLYIIEPTKFLLIILIVVIVALNGITLFYSYKTNRNLIFSQLFYFILYLCALEISPYIILYKVLV